MKLIILLAALVLTGSADSSPTPLPGRRIDIEKDPNWIRYQQRFEELRADPPVDELLALTKENKWWFRSMAVWVKLAPPTVTEPRRRRLTAFLEDSAGNRLRSFPDEISFHADNPAQTDREGLRPAKDGEASEWLTFAPDQLTARVIVTVPWNAGQWLDVQRSLTGTQGLFPGKAVNPVKPEDTAAYEKSANALRRDARERMTDRKRFQASRSARGTVQQLLILGRWDEALGEARWNADAYRSPTCLWLAAQILRRQGEDAECRAAEEELVKNFPDSVPAQFVKPQPGEQWWTPFNAYLIPLQQKP